MPGKSRARTLAAGRPWIAGAALALAACGPSAEDLEAAAVVRAANVLRDAPSDPLAERQVLLDELARRPASGDAAAARDACVRAYRPLFESAALRARVEAALADPARLDGRALVDLEEAEVKIKESAAAMGECDAGLAAVRRRVRIAR